MLRFFLPIKITNIILIKPKNMCDFHKIEFVFKMMFHKKKQRIDLKQLTFPDYGPNYYDNKIWGWDESLKAQAMLRYLNKKFKLNKWMINPNFYKFKK